VVAPWRPEPARDELAVPMPYLVCPACETPTFVVTRGDCPNCGAALQARAGAAAPATPVGGPTLRAALRMLVGQLHGDVALVSEIVGDQEIVRMAVSARGDGHLAPGTAAPLEETICKQLLDGRTGPVIADVAADPVVGGLPTTRALGIGAYIGVPVAVGGRLFVLCWMAREPRPDIGPRELRVCEGLAASVAAALDDPRG
jgi:GAF domain-containing protein